MNRNFGHAQLERPVIERKRPDIASQCQGLASFVEWLFIHPKQGVFQQNPNYGLTLFKKTPLPPRLLYHQRTRIVTVHVNATVTKTQ